MSDLERYRRQLEAVRALQFGGATFPTIIEALERHVAAKETSGTASPAPSMLALVGVRPVTALALVVRRGD